MMKPFFKSILPFLTPFESKKLLIFFANKMCQDFRECLKKDVSEFINSKGKLLFQQLEEFEKNLKI